MAVAMLEYNYNTGYAEFSYDDDTDIDKLPRIDIAGKDNLATVVGCSQGSMAIGTNGDILILKGETNEWIQY